MYLGIREEESEKKFLITGRNYHPETLLKIIQRRDVEGLIRVEPGNKGARVVRRKLVHRQHQWNLVRNETWKSWAVRRSLAWVVTTMTGWGVRMDARAKSRNKHRASVGWKMMNSVWYLLILRVVWMVTMEVSTGN